MLLSERATGEATRGGQRKSDQDGGRKGWSAPPWLLAQLLHFTLGFTIPLAAVMKGIPWYYGGFAILFVAFIKETTFDQLVEKDPFFWDGFVDLMMYALGVIAFLFFLRVSIPHPPPIPFPFRF